MLVRLIWRSVPSGVTQVRAASSLASRPRSAGLSRGLAASEITR